MDGVAVVPSAPAPFSFQGSPGGACRGTCHALTGRVPPLPPDRARWPFCKSTATFFVAEGVRLQSNQSEVSRLQLRDTDTELTKRSSMHPAAVLDDIACPALAWEWGGGCARR